MHDAYIGGRFRWTKITRKASDMAENLQLYRVVRFFHPRSSCTTTHISADIQRITLNASSCFVVEEHIRFFHGALQFFSFFLSANNNLWDQLELRCANIHYTSMPTLTFFTLKFIHTKTVRVEV